MRSIVRAASILIAWGAFANAGEPLGIRHVVVYREDGRFAGWPANHGIWSWGDEILVGFSRGTYKDRGRFHHIDHDRPEEFLLARSRDGGEHWAVERPAPSGALAGTAGMRHGRLPEGSPVERPGPLDAPIDFRHPDLALTVRMENANNGMSRFYYSYDRGHAWSGPFALPLFDQPGVMGRTDYLVEGREDCLLFLTASKADRREGRPFCARTSDGGRTWGFVAFIGPEPSGYAIMPATVRVAPGELVTTIRRRDGERSWIDAYGSRDDGKSWELLATPEPDTGDGGNPPSLVRLGDGRLCLVYGVRAAPYSIRARISDDRGRTWGRAIVLRDDGGSTDLGYVRSVVRPDGRVVSVYYFSDRGTPTRYIAATVFAPPRAGRGD
ncbi:MAG: sialidase family protein [Isosphaeraceae bacterium]